MRLKPLTGSGPRCQKVDLGGAIYLDLRDGKSLDDENIPFLT